MLTRNDSRRRVAAVASGGGHLIQLLRLRPAFENCDVTYVSTIVPPGLPNDSRVRLVPDANLTDKTRLIILLLRCLYLVLVLRPHVIVTTGAAPGFAFLVAGKLIGARTVWIDSIANSEELSSAGKRAKRWADLWLTQWPDLAQAEGPQYWGSVL